MTIYILESSPFLCAPGILDWALAHRETDGEHVVRVVTATWNIPIAVVQDLICGQQEYHVVGENIIVPV